MTRPSLQMFVQSRRRTDGLSGPALRRELRDKGVDEQVASRRPSAPWTLSRSGPAAESGRPQGCAAMAGPGSATQAPSARWRCWLARATAPSTAYAVVRDAVSAAPEHQAGAGPGLNLGRALPPCVGSPAHGTTLVAAMTAAKTYEVRTHGCQMNVHDSERLAGLLETAGYVDVASLPAQRRRDRRRRRLQHLRRARERRQQALRQPGAAACRQAAQPRHADRRRRLHGPEGPRHDRRPRSLGGRGLRHAQHRLAARRCSSGPGTTVRRRSRSSRSLETFPSTLPTRRESRLLRLGLDLRGLQQHVHVLHRARLARHGAGPPPRARCWPRSGRSSPTGVVEVTLLGQNVNTYGVRVRRPVGLRQAAARLRRHRRASSGSASPARTRRRSRRCHRRPWPRPRTSCRACTCRCSPGSDRILQGDAPLLPQRALPAHPRRGAGAHPGRGDHDRHHRRLPRRDRSGLPGHAGCGRAARFASAFTFQYSPGRARRPPTMADQVPKAVVQERSSGSSPCRSEICWAENRALEGCDVEVLVAPREGRKDAATQRRSGRARDNRLVHFALPAGMPASDAPRPGDLVTVGVTYGAPHHLVADSSLRGGRFSVRPTLGGDAWSARQKADNTGPVVALGMPTLLQPAAAPTGLPGCC